MDTENDDGTVNPAALGEQTSSECPLVSEKTEKVVQRQPKVDKTFDLESDDGGIEEITFKWNTLWGDDERAPAEHVRLNSFAIDLNNAIGLVKKYELVFVLYKRFKEGAKAHESRSNISPEHYSKYAIGNVGAYEYDGCMHGGYDLAYGPPDPVRKRMRSDMLYQFFSYVKRHFGLWLGAAKGTCLLYDCDRTVYSNVDLRIGKDGFCHTLTELEKLPPLVQEFVKTQCRDQAEMTAVSIFLRSVGEIDVRDVGNECAPNKEFLDFQRTVLLQSVFERYNDHVVYGQQYFNLSPERRSLIHPTIDGLMYQVVGFEVAVQLIPIRGTCATVNYRPVLRMIPTSGVFFEDHANLVVSLIRLFRSESTLGLQHACNLPGNVELASKLLNGAFVSFDHGKEVFAIDHLDPRTPSQITFLHEGNEISVKEYLYEKYHILVGSDLPCVARKVADNNLAYYPIDVLKIVHKQKLQSHLLSHEVQEKITSGAVFQPGVALNHINEALTDMQIDKDNQVKSEFFYSYGIHLKADFHTKVAFMTSPPPTIQYGNCKLLAENGKWWSKSISYISSARVPNVVFVNTCVEEVHLISQFVVELAKKMKERRMSFDNPEEIRIVDLRGCYTIDKTVADMLNLTEHLIKSTSAELLFYVAGKSDGGLTHHLIHDVFKTAEFTNDLTSKLGKRVVTQNVSVNSICKTVSKGSTTRNCRILEGLVMKTNMKLGGTNYKLDALPSTISPDGIGLPTSMLVVGVDIRRHQVKFDATSANRSIKSSSSANRHHPSVAALTYMFSQSDGLVVRGSYWFQSEGDDFHELQERLKESLTFYNKKNGSFPVDVFVYWHLRHMSENTDLSCEVNHLQQAMSVCCSSVPSLTVIATDQNPKTRLFPANTVGHDRKIAEQNVKPGTWIEETMTHQEFTMISHASERSLACPVRYRVVNSTRNFSGSEVQDLTNALCYLQNNGWEAISVPPPLSGAIKLTDTGLKSYNVGHEAIGRPLDESTEAFEEHVMKITARIQVNPTTIFWS